MQTHENNTAALEYFCEQLWYASHYKHKKLGTLLNMSLTDVRVTNMACMQDYYYTIKFFSTSYLPNHRHFLSSRNPETATNINVMHVYYCPKINKVFPSMY